MWSRVTISVSATWGWRASLSTVSGAATSRARLTSTASGASASNLRWPKTWLSEDTTKEPATRPEM